MNKNVIVNFGLAEQLNIVRKCFVQLGFNRVTNKKSCSILIYFRSHEGIYTPKNGLIKSWIKRSLIKSGGWGVVLKWQRQRKFEGKVASQNFGSFSCFNREFIQFILIEIICLFLSKLSTGFVLVPKLVFNFYNFPASHLII